MKRKKTKTPPQKFPKMLFLPRCLRETGCRAEEKKDVGLVCELCNESCQIFQIKNWAEGYQFEVFIVTGGSLVSKLVAKHRPKRIFRVACQKEINLITNDGLPKNLTIDYEPLTVDGCIETKVDLEKIKDRINTIFFESINAK